MSINIPKKDISVPDLIAAIIFWFLLAAWIIVLFYLSSESGIESTERSNNLLKTLELLFGEGNITETVIRKGAHITEYAILTFLAFMAVRFTNRISVAGSYAESPVKLIKSDNEMYITLSLWLSTLTAVVDEYHQLFIEGRNGSIIDVLIDEIGIIVVLIIIRIIFSIILARLGRKELSYE